MNTNIDPETGLILAESDDYRYLFNGMEKDDEVAGHNNSYDFGARFYNPRMGRWLSTDPLFSKYPSISPYAFVQNSPLLFLEIDGRDYIVVVDHEAKTITIQATYYVPEESQSSYNDAVTATRLWNEQSGEYEYQIGKGKNKVSYDINFELTVEKSDDPNEELYGQYKDMSKGATMVHTEWGDDPSEFEGNNVFYTLPDDQFDKAKKKYGHDHADGITGNGKFIIVPETESIPLGGAHEIGHTLGIEHLLGTVMGEDNTKMSPNLSAPLVAAILGNAGFANNYYPDAVNPVITVVKELNETSESPEISTEKGRVKKKK